jgi:GNAT superfamily N-acetyltransferase
MEDLDVLERILPLGGNGHAHRLRLQGEGRCLYLVAVAPQPVGSCLVHWYGPTDATVRKALPDCVEINHLQVIETSRGQGAGRALLLEAERAAIERGRPMIGIGVDDDNPRARRLYEHLGYRPGGARYFADYRYDDPDGRELRAVETGDFLVKALPGQ